MEIIDENASGQAPKIPTFLKVLCILTYVWTGIGLLGTTSGLMSGPMSAKELEIGTNYYVQMGNQARADGMSGLAHMFDQLVDMAYHVNEHYYGNLLMSLFVFGTGLAGALLMWKGRKLGFHAYIVYSILYITTIYLFVPVNAVPSTSPIINGLLAGLFIFMYSRNLKWMK